MARVPESVSEFLRGKRFAVAGVSRASAQPANAIYRRLKDCGYEVFAINPNASKVEGVTAYPDLASIPVTVDGVVIATHPDSDHIGGLIDVIARYEVKTIIMTNNVNDTPAYDAFMQAAREEGVPIVYAMRGQIFDLGTGAMGSTTLTILFPDRDVTHLESNTASIVAQLSYGAADVLLTADSPDEIETYLVDSDGAALTSEVLKVGHHGSRTSTDPQFLAMVQPAFGIISAGKDNDYGHPHKEVMDTLRQYGVETKNTADVGSIFMESDGASIWFR